MKEYNAAFAGAPLICVVGARPNYMKMAPIMRAFAGLRPALRTLRVHTGQHYDPLMKDRLLLDLELPAPDEMLGLTASARVVLTDSGGIQEKTTALGVPCLTLRENTERPITIEQGANTLVGVDPEAIVAEASNP
jgi:UDP-N-acetylglucosamine 2-epimerase